MVVITDYTPNYATRAMQIAVLLLLAIAPVTGCDREKPAVSAVKHDAKKIAQVRIASEIAKGHQDTRIVVVNTSADFICINRASFDPEEQLVMFVDEKGHEFRTQMPGDRFPRSRLNFEYDDSYVLLQPAEERKILFDTESFHLPPGHFRYHLFMPFYVCRDVIDLDRIKNQKDVELLATEGEGDFQNAPDG